MGQMCILLRNNISYNKSHIINDLLALKQFTLILEQISLLDSCGVDLGVNH